MSPLRGLLSLGKLTGLFYVAPLGLAGLGKFISCNFANCTLQNENFCGKMRNLIEKLHFLAKLFGHSEKKSYLCMLFRGEASLARVYTGARSLSRAGRRAGGKHGNI